MVPSRRCLILLCDIERPLRTAAARALNRVVGRRMIRAAATQNVEGEHVGLLNRLFEYLYQIRIAGQWLKARSRPFYYAIKWALTGALLYAVFR